MSRTKNQIRSFFILLLWGASILFTLTAPSEIYGVYVVKNASPIDIKITSINVSTDSCSNSNTCVDVAVRAINLASNEPITELIKMEPGAMPFSIVFFDKVIWSSYTNYLEIYKADNHYTAYVTSDGEYYLSRGSYIPFVPLLLLSLLWLAVNAVIILKRKPSDESDNPTK